MKKLIIPLLAAAMLLTACGEKDLGTWEMPAVDAAPTTEPTQAPTFGSYSGPESYVWNEALSFDMADPGVGEYVTPTELSHSKSLELFGESFLPSTIFSESYSQYTYRSLQKTEHQVLLDSKGELMANAYVEYSYLTKSKNEKLAITVMAELCDHDTVVSIYNGKLTPHVTFEDGVKPKMSSYYLNSFLLFRVGDQRYAQVTVLPSSYFARVSALESSLAEGEELSLPRQVVLTMTCGEDVSDEEFIAAVCQIWNTGSGNAPEPVVVTEPPLQMGDKGFA
jgi:hypothetical protein